MQYSLLAKEIKCPVCSTNKAQQLWSVSSKEAAQHFVLAEKYPERFSDLVSHIETLWGQNTCEVVRCNNCEFCYSNPYIAGDARFYSLAYIYSTYPSWKWEFQKTYDVLAKHSGSKIKFMEIGAGDGAFVKRVAENIIPKENIFCTEFSVYGREQIEKFGVKCLPVDFRTLSSPELMKSFDAVCMFQVLEHLDNLSPLFQKLNWLMKSGGSLFIAVPNGSRIEFNELNDALLDMPPNHIGRWNKKCFEIIGKQNGFRVEDYKIEEDSFVAGVKEFAFYRLLRRSQKSGSFENKLFKIKNKYAFKIMKMMAFAINLVIAIPVFTQKNSRLGSSQWVHFIKTND